jgi:hypothetical protein
MKLLEKKMVLKWLIFFYLMLVTLHILTNYILMVPWTIRNFFDFNAEVNIPTWFSSAQLLLLFILSIMTSIQIDNKHLRSFYSLMAIVFLFFSVDEVSEIHEKITKISNKLGIYLYFPHAHGVWIYGYSILLIVVGLLFWKGLLAFLNENIGRKIFIIGAVTFIAGGVGLEAYGYYIQNSESIFSAIEVIAEESFELIGESLMIYALLSKLYSKFKVLGSS